MPTALTASHGVTLPSMPSSSFSSSSSAHSVLSPFSSSLLSSSSPSTSSSPLDPVLTSIRHLLSRALSLPCSTAAQAFTQLVQPTLRFQVALDALLPLLDGDLDASSSFKTNANTNPSAHNDNQVAQRILVSFILFSLYAPYPISINPFRSALFMAFVNERERAIHAANAHVDTNSVTGGAETPSSEQLVWVLWKILRGDGTDIGPYTPSTLARSPLPPKLAAINLILDDTDGNDIDIYYTPANKAGSGQSFGTNNYAEGNVNDTSRPTTFIPASEDLENAVISRGLALLLAARERVLSLSERRTLEPIFHTLAASDIITPHDLSSIVTFNPDVAFPLLVELLTASISSPSNFLDLLDVLPYLPPSLSTFDIMGKLLRDTRLIPIPNAIPHLLLVDRPDDAQNHRSGSRIPLGTLIRYQVLARFIHECIERLEKEEKERLSLEGPGGTGDGDDAWGRGVRNLCRFYLSLIKLNIVQNAKTTSGLSRHRSVDREGNYDTESFSADTVEIATFALRNSRFEEARMLYGVLATGSFDM
ncbi:hypothetical protein J3R30DRAFT_3438969 [Lentinula aciculospora]|uniref:CCR4-NOT transcription complex subunit 11 n=1 Tax=Lentinula aciculospora TaxID=153920 RepID=A0A9W9ALB0_9AGAR|nr:hypothetical protein J3R30DRAFT_3438969 [Lentinula aciculospora]